MAKRREFISVNELKPGMVLADNIMNNNVVMISTGMVISEAIIAKLREMYLFGKVAVWVNEEDKKKDSVEKEKTVQDIDQSFKDISVDIERIFVNHFFDGINDMEEIRGFAKRVQDELNTPSAVIKNIVLYGSGSDRIFRHSVNVAALSNMLGKWLDFSEKDITLLTYSGILHDFGKTKVDKNILSKPASLTQKELQNIKDHPVIGYNYVKKIPFLDPGVSLGVLMHHERIDGSGYPLKIKGEKIHSFGKVIGIADVFDAVNSNKLYRKSSGPFEALEIIQKESLGKLDYQYCKIFLEHIINYYMGENVLLNTGKVCKIIQVNINDLSRPLLFDGTNFIDLRQERGLSVEKLMV